jgi:hypothetical protein
MYLAMAGYKLLRQKKKKETNNLMEVEPSPLVVERLMTRSGTHLSHASTKRVRLCPRSLNLLTTCPANSLHIPKGEARPARGAMAIDVPTGYADLDLRFFAELHVRREFFHMKGPVLAPLAPDVVGENNAANGGPRNRGQQCVINTAIPLPCLKIPDTVLPYETMPWA